MNERMLQRCYTWDYRARGIYMITLTTHDRRPLFGRLVGGEAAPAICRSALGELVARCWEAIPKYFPEGGANVEAPMVMPDHFHGVLFVYKEQAKPLGAIIRGFKAGVTKEARALGLVEAPIRSSSGWCAICFWLGTLSRLLATTSCSIGQCAWRSSVRAAFRPRHSRTNRRCCWLRRGRAQC